MSGTGGQGILLAGMILGHAGIKDGKYVAGSSAYGAQARGGYSRTGTIISNEPIHFPHVIEADVLVAMSQETYDECIDNVVGEDGVVIYDKGLVSIKEIKGLKQIGIPATEMVNQVLNSKKAANMVILGAMVGITNVVTKNALILAMEENVSNRFKGLNLKAIELGFKLLSTLN
jgi:2-oxoglutarate ferredoxin oxidoreductase subunit gamma